MLIDGIYLNNKTLDQFVIERTSHYLTIETFVNMWKLSILHNVYVNTL